MKNAERKKIPANVLLLSVVSLLNDLSSEMIMPILPMFLESLHAGAPIIGLVGGLRDSLSSVLKILCGYWSDRAGKRKVFVFSGYLTSTIFKLLLALSRAWPTAVVFSTLERIGKGLRTAARDAIIADSMTTNRGKGFGLHRSFDTAGALLGTIVTFLLFWFLDLGFNTIILIAGFVGLASLVPLHFVTETPSPPHDVTLKIGLRNLPRRLKLFVLVSGTFALGNFSYMFFIMRAQDIFTGRLRVAAPVLLYVLFNLSYSALAIPLGAATDRVGRQKVIIFGYLVFAATSIGFALLNSLAAFIVLFVLYGVVYAAVDGSQRAFVSDLADPKLKATALGTYHAVTGLAALPASALAGLLWQTMGPVATFIYGAVCAGGAVLLFVLSGVHRRQAAQ